MKRILLVSALLLASVSLFAAKPFKVTKGSVDVFDFDDLYVKIFYEPFVQLADKDGYETLRISGMSLISLLMLFFILRYVNRAIHAIHAIHRYARYAAFMRKHNRTTILNNFIYGIQLMGGRLRVGDWIECDGAVKNNFDWKLKADISAKLGKEMEVLSLTSYASPSLSILPVPPGCGRAGGRSR